MQLVCALMKSFCRLIEFKGARKKQHGVWGKWNLPKTCTQHRFGELWELPGIFSVSQKICQHHQREVANKYCWVLFLYARGRKLSLIKYFFHCTICIWLCNNNENWKQIFYACEKTRNFSILTICDSITFSRAYYSGIACNENQILSLERDGGGGCHHQIYVFQYGTTFMQLFVVVIEIWSNEIWNFDINIWLQYF